MIVYYENSKGEQLNLLKAPYRTMKTDWFDADWSESSDGYEKTVTIDVFGKRNEFQSNMERLYKIIAVDAENEVYGKLYVNGAYLPCRVLKSSKDGWKGYVYSQVEITFIAPELVWTIESTQQFFPRKEEWASSGMNFPEDFPFDFSPTKKGTAVWEVDHIIPSDFELIIYGPCVNPRILVNEYPYEVYVTLERNEYLIIDSRTNTVMRYLQNGTAQSAFNERSLENSVFKKIPEGLLNINWSGEFGFDLTLFLNRREPPW